MNIQKLNFQIKKGELIGLCQTLDTQEDMCFQDRINKLIDYCKYLEQEINKLKEENKKLNKLGN